MIDPLASLTPLMLMPLETEDATRRPATSEPSTALSPRERAALGLIVLSAAALFTRLSGLLAFAPSADRWLSGILNATLSALLVLAGLAALVLLRRLQRLLERTDTLSRQAAQGVEQLEALSRHLEHLASKLDAPPGTAHARPAIDAGAGLPFQLRDAIRAGLWDEAQRLLDEIERESPDSTETRELAEELARGRQTAAEGLRARLEASRSANDPESVLDVRGQLLPLLPDADRHVLDRDLLKWLMALLMRRMRTGTVRSDVALLAERVSEAFPATPEGASLRASLPTLRRSGGLCPRCAQPYTGLDDACPQCLAGPSGPRIFPLPSSQSDEEPLEA